MTNDMAVTVWSDALGREVDLTVDLNADGRIVVIPPAPGPFALDPFVHLGPFKYALDAAARVAGQRLKRPET